jgi:hypothetical protein
MDRHGFAVWAVLAGLLLGVLGDLLFFGKLIGLSFPLFVLVVVGITLLSILATRQPIRWRNAWPLIPLGFFALMVTVLDSPSLLATNLLAVLTQAALAAYYLTTERPLDKDPFAAYVSGVIEAGFASLFLPMVELGNAWGWFKQRGGQSRNAWGAVARGLVIALPLLLVFGLLLGSADPIFGEIVGQIGRLFEIENFEELLGHFWLIAILGWAACGIVAYATMRDHHLDALTSSPSGTPAAEPDPFAAVPLEDVSEAPPPRTGLGMIEAGIVLGSVDLLFGAFVLIQLAYFFGGRVNVSVEGLTYAEYARRGFFELVAVAALTLGLALALDQITRRESPLQHAIFRVLEVIVVVLTAIILLSAWQRMSLYEHEYGFTHLRLYTHLFMLWMAVLFGFFLLSLFRVREHIFSLGLLICLIGYLVTLNLVNPDYMIAERNVSRYAEGYPLDFVTLNDLSADMIPTLVPLYLDTAGRDPEAHQCAAQVLSRHLKVLDHYRAGLGATILSANRSREQAWALLDLLRADLPDVEAGYLYQHNCNDTASQRGAGVD